MEKEGIVRMSFYKATSLWPDNQRWHDKKSDSVILIIWTQKLS